MEIVHVAAECYPVAKAGGLGDVVGALPKYQTELGHVAKVVMPMYRTKFLYDNEWELMLYVSETMSLTMDKNNLPTDSKKQIIPQFAPIMTFREHR